VTVLNLVLAVPIALRVRLMRHQRLLTTILVMVSYRNGSEKKRA
jgi:putative spermidine/putrescine transport system permease protein